MMRHLLTLPHWFGTLTVVTLILKKMASKCTLMFRVCFKVMKTAIRPGDSLNDKLATGAVEVLASGITVLNSVKGNLPFPVSVHDEENTREELRLRHRYLDLRRKRMNDNLRLRAQTIQAARRFLEDAGFIEVETPVLTRSTPEGARDYVLPSRVCGGEWFALPQSPQLFKQLLMVGGIERYYQVARCFRDEDLRADRQPEFTLLERSSERAEWDCLW